MGKGDLGGVYSEVEIKLGMAKMSLVDELENASTVGPSDKGLTKMVTCHACPNTDAWKRMHK